MLNKYKNLNLKNEVSHVKSWFSSHLDLKIYVIFSLISLIFLFYSIWKIRPVVVDVKDFLGLASHLSLEYWIGYILAVFFSIKLYLDKKIKKDIIYILYLIVIGLYLFGVPIFAEDNARFPWSYYPAGEVKTVMETKYVNLSSQYPVMTYRSWPALHLISASILYLTDIKIENVLKYFPLFWVFSVILITFSIGKRLRLLSNQSFLASFLILASFWGPLYYYGPVSIAYLLYLLLFMFIVAFSKIIPNNYLAEVHRAILISLTFITLIITHILTPIMIISSFIFSSSFIQSLHKKRTIFIIFFIILFTSWYLYLAQFMFETGVKEVIKQVSQPDIFGLFKTGKYSSVEIITFSSHWIVRYSRLFYIGVYAIAMIVASTFYITGRIKKDNKELTKICFFWLIGIFILFVIKYGAEIDERIYLFSLVPMGYIITFTFDRKILTVLAILLILPHIPAHYGTESSDLIRTTELNGAKFFAEKTIFHIGESYFSMWDTFIDYYDPEKVKIYGRTLSIIEKPDPTKIDNSTYIINSNGSYNFLFYTFGFDPLKEWIQFNQGKINQFYDNGFYQIFKIK
ncbi:MAG: hypothetical protein Q7J35_02925 [Candidatus Methanoperedens sp.]|nr:hypothetical protein [Candidatus Methanoperedens sp.]